MTRYTPEKFLIYGAGIIGAALMYNLRKYYPDCEFVICDPNGVGGIQTHQCSNMLHTGILSPQGTLKREFCKAALYEVPVICKKLNVDFKNIIKVVYFENTDFKSNIANYADNSKVKFIQNCNHVGEHVCYEAFLINYTELAKALYHDVCAQGGVTHKNKETCISEYSAVFVCTGNEVISTLSQLHESCEWNTVYIDSTYVVTNVKGNEACYKVQFNKMPFLGVHTTPELGGNIKIGPNALFSMKNFKLTRGWRARMLFLTKIAWFFVKEYLNRKPDSFKKIAKAYVDPNFLVTKIKHGTRSIIVDKNGNMAKDFVFHESKKPIFACLNTSSPGASCCFQIADHLINQYQKYDS